MPSSTPMMRRSSGTSFLSLLRPEASSGRIASFPIPYWNFSGLKPIDPAETNQAWDEYKKVSGIPTHFDMLGATIRLKPAPDYSQTASLKATFQREPSYFESTDTTKKPGFASVGHIILAMGAAYDWGISKGKANTSILRQEVEQRREEIRAFYSRRNKYEQPQLSAKYTSSR